MELMATILLAVGLGAGIILVVLMQVSGRPVLWPDTLVGVAAVTAAHFLVSKPEGRRSPTLK